jgi:Raf kinase inhibitor-like YbhB/YbcL family protein
MGIQRVLAKITMAALLLGLAACATNDGKTLRPPTAPAPTSTVAESTSPNPPSDYPIDSLPVLPGDGADAFQIAVPWVPGGEMDPRFGCAGEGLSPSVAWESVPEGTTEIAVVISDQAGQILWMLLGINPTVIAIPEAVSSEGLTRQSVEVISNDFGVADWTPPCPPVGTSELLLVTVYALNQQIEGASAMSPAEIADLLGFVSIDIAEVTGVYSRPA